ncbi:hypothetical protein ACTXT7_013426 [Hymenolepis weldensis]
MIGRLGKARSSEASQSDRAHGPLWHPPFIITLRKKCDIQLDLYYIMPYDNAKYCLQIIRALK